MISSAGNAHTLIWDGKTAVAGSAKKSSVFMLRADIQNSRNFYNTNNMYIAGDNLEALKLLRNGYSGRIKFIYVEPPHNSGKISKESEWLTMIYPRLLVAHSLLAENGIIFINIDAGRLQKLKLITDEIFDIKNFIAQFLWKRRRQKLEGENKHIICYAKNSAKFKAGSIPKCSDDEYPYLDETTQLRYKRLMLRKWGANCRRADKEHLYYPIKAPDNTDIYPILKKCEDGCWRWEQEKLKYKIDEGAVEFVKLKDEWQVYEKVYETQTNTQGDDTVCLKKLFNSKVFDYSKPEEFLRLLLNAADTADGDIILDFFAGASITAQAVMKQNAADGIKRRFILAQIPENTEPESDAHKAGFRDICELGIEKLNRAADNIANSNAPYKNDTDKGYKLFKIVRPQKMPL